MLVHGFLIEFPGQRCFDKLTTGIAQFFFHGDQALAILLEQFPERGSLLGVQHGENLKETRAEATGHRRSTPLLERPFRPGCIGTKAPSVGAVLWRWLRKSAHGCAEQESRRQCHHARLADCRFHNAFA
jgi:hypothetical protein